jgi:hypothetical protein
VKKVSTVQAFGSEIFKEQKLTIGVDLGDRWSGLLMEGLESALLLLGAYPLFQEHLHSFADFLSDRSAYLYLYRQHVPAVAHSHERTFERMTINCAFNFNQATCTEKLD